MTEAESLKYLIYSDLYRYHGRASLSLLLRTLVTGIGFKCSFWMRVRRHLSRKPAIWLPARIVAQLMHRRYTIKYGIGLDFRGEIGPGLFIGHFGGIFVNEQAKIGRNCSISHGVTIGDARRGRRAGAPTIGDNVFIGPGAKILGNVRIGDNAAIGANCVVTSDVPDNGVVVGIPGRVISQDSSAAYMDHIDYDEKI
jgi:serine O-acetyltransferase